MFHSRNNAPLTTNNVRRRLRAILTEARIEDVTPHAFRRTVATVIDRAAGTGRAAELFGHTSADMHRKTQPREPAHSRDSRSGLTQEALASRVGVDQARVSRSEGRQGSPRFDTVDKLLAATGHRLYGAPTRRDDAASIASSIHESVEAKDPKWALRKLIQLNDNLVAETGLVHGVLGLAEPESARKKLWDAAIAAVVAWRLNEQNLPLPEWVSDPKRKLERPRPRPLVGGA